MTQAICAYEKVQDIQANKIDDENELRWAIERLMTTLRTNVVGQTKLWQNIWLSTLLRWDGDELEEGSYDNSVWSKILSTLDTYSILKKNSKS